MVAALRLLVAAVRPERIVYDAGAPIAAALESAAIDGDWPVVGLASRQMAGAAANLEAHVLSGDMCHDGSLLFAQQLAGAGRMKVGDGWKFSRRAR